MVGQYQIVRRIGRGGMGVVYEGLLGGVGRRVAIKVIRSKIKSSVLLTRFEEERKALALCSHPSIVLIFDQGATADGQPFFVMDYLEGAVPITQYSREKRLSGHARLALFQKVCAPVQHAHQRALIHCDLKPSNILVTPSGEVMLIDFGLARVLAEGDEVGDASPLGSLPFLGTPDYASPEQLRGHFPTTQSDVYSLGAVLYELMTGEKACDFSTEGDYLERLQSKLDGGLEPPRNVGTRLADLPTSEREDLELIILKAMDVNVENRLASAAEFSEAIRLLVSGQPIPFRRLTIMYDLLKFFHRHRTLTAIVTIVFLFLGVAMVLVARKQAAKAKEIELSLAERDRAKRADQARAHLEKQVFISVFGRALDLSTDPVVTGDNLQAAVLTFCAVSDDVWRHSELRHYAHDSLVLARICPSASSADEGLRRLEEAANRGDLGAATILAARHPIPTISNRWRRVSADAGVTAGQFLLARDLLFGTTVPRDAQAAYALLRKAARRGDLRSQEALCELCEEDDGKTGSWSLDRSLRLNAEAHVWCTLAACNRVRDQDVLDGVVLPNHAAESRDRIEQKLSPNDLAASRAFVKEVLSEIGRGQRR